MTAELSPRAGATPAYDPHDPVFALHQGGKLEVRSRSPLVGAEDLALAYTPGVAKISLAIAEHPELADTLTWRGNTVAVVTDGSAVLGLGDIGPAAALPVMEGKAVLFKKFANIDVFDIEISEKDPAKLIDIIAALEPTFGGINLEDIKAPECFQVERTLRERMRIPVFHDDQHGTAIIVGAAVLNGLKVVGKRIEDVKLVCSGAGAAALACLRLLEHLGLSRQHIWVSDLAGVVWEGRTELMDPDKARYAQATDARRLSDIIDDADIFLGLSAGGVLKPDMVARMAPRPLILALANPTPEILPEEVKAVRDDAVIATGRSDYPNQVNNVLCFPYIFRGALDCGATTITTEMEVAAVRAIAELAQMEQSDVVAAAYGGQEISFGPNYLIPRPFDPRLILHIAPAVAKAAADSGVATRPVADLEAYRDQLQQFVYQSGAMMRPIFSIAKHAQKKRIVYAEGEDERVLRAVRVVVDEHLARPILVGRPAVIAQRVDRFGLRLQQGRDYEVVNTDHDERYREFWQTYQKLAGRKGVTPPFAKIEMRRRLTLISAMMLHKGEADGMICGTWGNTHLHLHYIDQVIGKRPGAKVYAAMNGLILPGRQVMLVDTHINLDPSAEDLAEITLMAAEEMRRFGIAPKVALLSHSNFGSSNAPSALKMRQTLEVLHQRAPDLEVDGEMHGDCAFDPSLRSSLLPETTLSGEANLLVFPGLDAANIAYNLLKATGSNNVAIGPILLGAAQPVNILTASSTVRRIVNVTALTVMDANSAR